MQLTRTTKVVLTVVAAIWLAVGVSVLRYALADAEETQDNIYTNIRLFQEVLYKVKQNYVEDTDPGTLIKAAIEGMLKSLDPHTNFFDPEDFSDFNTQTKGEFGGLGITIDKTDDYITVVSPMEGTPAYEMGIIAGDKIAKVDGFSMKGVSTDEAIKRMRGEPGTHVHVSIIRPGIDGELEFDIVRDVIKIKSVPYAFKVDNGVGYVRIRSFSETTDAELSAALDKLEREGIRGLIIDLRFNPGGLLDQAIDTVNEFVGKDKLVVFTKGRTKESNQEYYTRMAKMRTGYPVIALVNGGTASAAEIFSGSLQDWDKGLVVGEPTFGKGSVQRLFPLSGGNGIKITTSKYYIHSGRCIHKDINDRILRGDAVSEEDKEKAEEDSHHQIYKTELGRTVYGGGGITPDLFIVQDSLNTFEMELRRKNVFFDYTVEYMAKHRDQVERDFAVNNSVFQDFVRFAEEKGVKCSPEDVREARSWIETSLKSNIVARKFGEEEGYRAGLPADIQLMKTLALFDRWPTLNAMFQNAPTENVSAQAAWKAAQKKRSK